MFNFWWFSKLFPAIESIEFLQSLAKFFGYRIRIVATPKLDFLLDPDNKDAYRQWVINEFFWEFLRPPPENWKLKKVFSPKENLL